MCPRVCLMAVLFFCVTHATTPLSFESQDIVPVRINGRVGGRFWKRSEEQPRFVLSAFGKHMTLNLVPDNGFIAPSFSVWRVQRARGSPAVRKPVHLVNQSEDSKGDLPSCFYSGDVDRDPNSVVSVSLCSGIFGSFITEGNEYLIEPKFRGGWGSDSTQQLHVLKRKSFNNSLDAPLVFDYASAGGKAAERSTAKRFTHGDARGRPRRRRFVSAPRFIETLVVADSSMTHFYGDEIKVRRDELTLSCTLDSNTNTEWIGAPDKTKSKVGRMESLVFLPPSPPPLPLWFFLLCAKRSRSRDTFCFSVRLHKTCLGRGRWGKSVSSLFSTGLERGQGTKT